MAFDDGNDCIESDLEILAAPIAPERRIEHVAQPVQDDLAGGLRQDAVIDADIVVRPFGNCRQRPAGHHDRLAAEPFDKSELLFIGLDDVIDCFGGGGRQMVGAGARGEIGAIDRARLGDRAADQFLRVCPVETHAALRRVHRFGDAEAQPPQMVTERHRPLPVDHRSGPRIGHGERIGNDVRGGIGDTRKSRADVRLHGLADQRVPGAADTLTRQGNVHPSLPSQRTKWNVPINQGPLKFELPAG